MSESNLTIVTTTTNESSTLIVPNSNSETVCELVPGSAIESKCLRVPSAENDPRNADSFMSDKRISVVDSARTQK